MATLGGHQEMYDTENDRRGVPVPRRNELPMIDQVVRGEIEINNSTNKRFNRGNSVAAFGGTNNMRKSSMSARNSDLKKGFGT